MAVGGFVRLARVVLARRPVPLAALVVLAALAGGPVIAASRAQAPARARAEAADRDGSAGQRHRPRAWRARRIARATPAADPCRPGHRQRRGRRQLLDRRRHGRRPGDRRRALGQPLRRPRHRLWVRRTATARRRRRPYDGKVEGLKIAGRLIGDSPEPARLRRRRRPRDDQQRGHRAHATLTRQRGAGRRARRSWSPTSTPTRPTGPTRRPPPRPRDPHPHADPQADRHRGRKKARQTPSSAA